MGSWPRGPLPAALCLGVLGMIGTARSSEEPAADLDGRAEDTAPPAWRTLRLVTDGAIDPGWKHLWGGGFSVMVDGSLRTDCDDSGMGLLLYTKERFGDCQLRVVYRSEEAKSNAGVYIRIDDGVLAREDDPRPLRERDANGRLTKESLQRIAESSDAEREAWYPVHHGYEVQICGTGDEYHRTGAISSLAPAAPAPEKRPTEWKTMIITLQGEMVLVDVDGKRLASFDPDSPDVPARKHWSEPKREPRRPRAGFIGLQNHDPGDVVYFKEVSVRPLADKRAQRLKVGIVQMALAGTIAENRDRIVSGISSAAAEGVRVAVFPEGALRGEGGKDPALVEEAIAAIRRAARDRNVYVLFGGDTWSAALNKDVNWMLVVAPDGSDVLRYEKLYDNHRAPMPGVFLIDGVPCNAMICADRWLRGVEEIPIQQGAQVSFEPSNNFACEWVAPFQWYWNVPRALRNDVWVVFANSGNRVSGQSPTSESRDLRHGHSAIIAPDGRIAAATREDTETIVVADLDVSAATRAAAQARAAHPALRPFWEAGVKLQRGEHIDAPKLTPLESAEVDITIAAAQTSGDLPAMLSMIGEARAKNADLVVFPARAIDETALESLQAAAHNHGIVVVVGMEHRAEGGRYNSAFVIGGDGSLLTRYDQLSAASPLQAGVDPGRMWFRVKGVPAVVTIGKDALWTELAELAAVAGARLHVHLDHDESSGPEADLRRVQVWSNLASFHTFSATVNVVGSALWDDLRDAEERRAEVRGTPRPAVAPVEVYSPFSANLVARARAGPELLVATRHVSAVNSHYPTRTSRFNPQMDAWYRIGAAIVRPL